MQLPGRPVVQALGMQRSGVQHVSCWPVVDTEHVCLAALHACDSRSSAGGRRVLVFGSQK